MTRRILFISRTLGSSFGGMQTQASTLVTALQNRADVKVYLVGYGGGRWMLPVFFLRALFASLLTRCDTVHLGDAVLSPIFPILFVFRPRLRRTLTVHGLDLVWDVRVYRSLICCTLRFAQKIAAVSHATADVCIQRGVTPERIIIIPCGIVMPDIRLRKEFLCPVLLLFGRLVPRKGTRWFLENVFPLLLARYPTMKLVIAGDGPEHSAIQSLVAAHALQHSVDVLGAIPEHSKEALFQQASLLVMPNVPVFGDMEGFGITAVEAASRGLPVVASDLEGLKDSIIDGVTGLHFRPLDLQSAIAAIESAMSKEWNSQEMRKAIQEKFEITAIASRYIHEIF